MIKTESINNHSIEKERKKTKYQCKTTVNEKRLKLEWDKEKMKLPEKYWTKDDKKKTFKTHWKKIS